RVNRAGLGGLRRRDDLVDIEVGLAGWCRPQPDGVVGEVDVRGVDVGARIYGDGSQPELVNGADDAAGDLTAVGDQHAVEELRQRPRRVRVGKCGRHGCSFGVLHAEYAEALRGARRLGTDVE